MSETPSAPLDFDAPPGAPPAVDAPDALQAGRYYRVDSSRASYTELARDAGWLAPLAWLTKLLRIKLPGTVNDPNVVTLAPFVVPPEAVAQTVPAAVQEKLAPVLRELADLGFGPAVYFSIDDRFHHSRTCQAALLHRDGRTVARLTHRAEGLQSVRTHFFTEFLSGLAGGGFLCSSSARAQLHVPAACRLNWQPKATTSQLWVAHRQLLEAGRRGGLPVVLHGPADMLAFLEQHHEAVRDFHLARGVFASMQGEDLAQAEALDRSVAQAQAGQVRYPEIMAQLERLQKKQTSWTSVVLVLIVSIGLFVGITAGAWRESWELLFIIVGILLVHEAGHYVAMKLFRYRNVRMFFIPLLGAAVSGEHYTAPGWKKIIVALLGPLPGIFLGGVVGITGLIKGNPLLTKVGLMAVVLNGFQLLPVLPLDGGRVLHALLFSRHYSLETLFQVLAAGGLAGLGLLAGDKVLLYLGLFMLISVPTAFKVAKIATELRQQGLGPVRPPVPAVAAAAARPPWPPVDLAATQPPLAPPTSPPVWRPAADIVEEQSIPLPVAEAIIERAQARFPRLKSPKQLAALTLRVYETLATRPPGILASLAFVFLHGMSFVVALGLLVALAIPQMKGFGDLMAIAQVNPRHAVDPAAIRAWDADSGTRPAATDGTEPARETLIATFADAEDAGRTYDAVLEAAPPDAAAACFGQSVFLSLPASDEAARTHWLAEFEARTTDVFVSGGDAATSLQLTCMLFANGSAVKEQLDNFLDAPASLYLIPPWAGPDLDPRSADERTQHEAARTMLRKLRNTFVTDAPELHAPQEELTRAMRRNNQAEIRRLNAELSDLRHRLRLRELERLRDTAAGPAEREVAARYIAVQIEDREEELARAATRPASASPHGLPEIDEDGFREMLERSCAREREQLGPLLGQLSLTLDGGRPPPHALRYSCRYGSVMEAGGKLVIYACFEDVTRGAPALARWLAQHGGRDFHYELQGPVDIGMDED